jgi:hypothetical protein
MTTILRRSLTTLLLALPLAGCNGGISGTYEGNVGSLAFHGNKVDATLMGSTLRMDCRAEGNRIVLDSPQGELVLERKPDGSLDTPWGRMHRQP